MIDHLVRMDLDTALKLLANRHRRRILYRLHDQNPQEGIPATRVAHFGKYNLADLRTRMKHIHVPKMDDTDVIDVLDEDTNRLRVRRGDKFADVQPLLRALDSVQHDLPGMIL